MSNENQQHETRPATAEEIGEARVIVECDEFTIPDGALARQDANGDVWVQAWVLL
jgi:hypothetical protein